MVEEERESIEFIFNSLANGMSVRELVVHLRDKFNTGRNWHESMIHRIIKKPIYYGSFEYFGLKIEDHSPAIITKEVFDKVNSRKGLKLSNYNKGYVFKGLVSCRRCNSVASETSGTSRNGRLYIYYKCPVYKQSVNEFTLTEIYNVAVSEYYTSNKESVKHRMRDLENQRLLVIDMYTLGKISLPSYIKSLEVIDNYQKAYQESVVVQKGKSEYFLSDNRQKNMVLVKDLLISIKINYELKIYTFFFKNDIIINIDKRGDSYLVHQTK